jgi:hypothetical protein
MSTDLFIAFLDRSNADRSQKESLIPMTWRCWGERKDQIEVFCFSPYSLEVYSIAGLMTPWINLEISNDKNCAYLFLHDFDGLRICAAYLSSTNCR